MVSFSVKNFNGKHREFNVLTNMALTDVEKGLVKLMQLNSAS